MCGLFGYTGTGVNVSRLAHVADLATRRGPHSSGAAWDDGAGSRLSQAGAVGPWSNIRDHVLASIGRVRALRVIGHGRLATDGIPRTSANVQPLNVGSGLIAHNGVVPEHFARACGDGIQLKTTCDSELLGRWVEREQGPLKQRVDRALRRLAEPFALMALWPGELEVARRGLPLFAWPWPEGTYFCSVSPGTGATLIDEWQELNMTRTKPEDHPVSKLQWRDPATLHANSYNPNSVFPQELALLKESIIQDGWTQPVVIRADGEIVDGFHRWTISQLKEIAALTGGVVPCVVLDETDEVHQMMSTVRHNRARGQHGILKMGDIVRAAQEDGLTEAEICKGFGMEPEELDRLADVRQSPEHAGKDSFGRGWVPDPRAPADQT